MRHYHVLLFLICLLFATEAFSEKRTVIAVLDIKELGVSKITAKAVSNMIRSDLVNMGSFSVVERSQIDLILKEQGFQRTGCTDQECAVRVGKLVSARKILIGELQKLGSVMIITVRIVDVERGISEYAAREKAKSEEVLDEAITRITAKLAERIMGTETGFVPSKHIGTSKNISGRFLIGKIWKSEGDRSSLYMGNRYFFFKFLDNNVLQVSWDRVKFHTKEKYQWRITDKGILEIEYINPSSQPVNEKYIYKQAKAMKGERFVEHPFMGMVQEPVKTTLSVAEK
jgi:TolB-like protein